MTRRWFIQVVSVLAVFAATGFAQDAGRAWVTFRSEAGKFSVRLPGKPQSSMKRLGGPAGKVYIHAFTVRDADKGDMVVAYTDYPPGSVTEDDRQPLLDAVRDGSVLAVQGKVTAEKKIALGKLRAVGRDVLFEYPKGVCRERLFLKGDRLYQVAAIGPSRAWIASDAVARFLDSFEIQE